jgi:hypothetical protein
LGSWPRRAARVPNGPGEQPHEGGASLSGAQISAINRFPDDNPNPVLRVDDAGLLIYANPASGAVLRALGAVVGDRLYAWRRYRPMPDRSGALELAK